jgi:hypothetical protein
MFGEDEKSLAGDLANYNWKIFACSAIFDMHTFKAPMRLIAYFAHGDDAAMFFGAKIANFISI